MVCLCCDEMIRRGWHVVGVRFDEQVSVQMPHGECMLWYYGLLSPVVLWLAIICDIVACFHTCPILMVLSRQLTPGACCSIMAYYHLW